MKRITEIIRSKQQLFKNFTSLSLLQLSNYLFPLITLPYLVRVLGPEKYGLVNFAISFSAFFNIITDYGFNLSVTKEISVNRNDYKTVNEIFSSVFIIKFILLAVSLLVFLIIIYSIPLFHNYLLLYIIIFFSVAGTAIFPLWFFQGIEKMGYIFSISFSVRVLVTSLIFLLIKTENDFILYAGLTSITYLLIGISGFLIALIKFRARIIFPGIIRIKDQLTKGWQIFLSTVSINIYTNSNVFILGLFAPEIVVGYYAAADKVRIAFQGILSPISQSVYPYVNKLLSESYERFINFNKKLLVINSLAGLTISLSLFLLAEPIINIILGPEYKPSIIILKIISWLPFFIFISNVFGIQTLLPLNMHKKFTAILIIAAVLNLILSFVLVPAYFSIGTSIAVLLTEAFVTIVFLLIVKKNKINLL